MKGATEHVSRIRLSRGLEVIKVGVFNFNYRKEDNIETEGKEEKKEVQKEELPTDQGGRKPGAGSN